MSACSLPKERPLSHQRAHNTIVVISSLRLFIVVGNNLHKAMHLRRHCSVVGTVPVKDGLSDFVIEHGLLRVDRGLVLRGIADEAVTRAGLPRHVRRSDPVTLVVRKDINTTILLQTDAGVR